MRDYENEVKEENKIKLQSIATRKSYMPILATVGVVLVGIGVIK